ncbi:DUF6766 family protein [Streptomyces sp. NPDC051771]|uniref:DUF6766 family protein n=1 Tax=Streptomyces sp. NPDC051771 TaxID=3154847 RepID=UPI00342131F5
MTTALSASPPGVRRGLVLDQAEADAVGVPGSVSGRGLAEASDAGPGASREGEGQRPEKSPRWAAAKDWRQLVYSRSLGLVMGGVFLLSWAAQSIAGVAAYDEQRLRQLLAPVGWGDCLASPDFGNRTFQKTKSAAGWRVIPV